MLTYATEIGLDGLHSLFHTCLAGGNDGGLEVIFETKFQFSHRGETPCMESPASK